MQIQTALSGIQNERIFRVARNSNTKTATITAASFSRGAPALLATASASVNGFDIVNATTKGQPVNNMLIGVVADYPDTSAGRTGVWQPEDVGLVQCYGLYTNAHFVQATKTDSFLGGILLGPSTQSAWETFGRIVAELAGTATVATNLTGLTGGIGGLVVLAQSIDTAASETRDGVAIFLRCM